MRGMRNPLRGLGTQQSPVRSSRLLPATHFLHTRGQKPRGGWGLAQGGHTVAELGLRTPSSSWKKSRNRGEWEEGSPAPLGWCGRPGQ